MSNSSQPKNSLDTYLTDTITIDDSYSIDLSSITMNSTTNYISSGNTITITSSGSGGYSTFATDTISTDGYVFNWGATEEWIDGFPDWDRVKSMCEQYPGLEIALRNLQTIYTLVKDDYDNPKDKK